MVSVSKPKKDDQTASNGDGDSEMVKEKKEDKKAGPIALHKVRFGRGAVYKCLGCHRNLFTISTDYDGFCYVECENCGDQRYC